ncbi:MAG: hypothetical protein IPO05_05790 [Flavobacteriales bacterium]|nr:hypothetical protein [Flavobacteriales bacterium]
MGWIWRIRSKSSAGDEFDVKLYYLVDRNSSDFLGIEANGPGAKPVPLAFRTLDQAIAMRRWLVRSGSTMVRGQLIKWGNDAGSTAFVSTDVNRITIDEQSLQPKSLR